MSQVNNVGLSCEVIYISNVNKNAIFMTKTTVGKTKSKTTSLKTKTKTEEFSLKTQDQGLTSLIYI